MITENLTTTPQTGIYPNPFPGLRPFEFDESHLFFGREGQSEQLISKLSRTHFLAVVGTSGSGKSSLVRAGLLPTLIGGFMTYVDPDSTKKRISDWRIAVLRPGNDPIGNLARALNEETVFGSEIPENADIQIALTDATLRRSNLGLVDAVNQALMPDNEHLLVVVDQFEELFRFAKVSETSTYKNQAAAFVKLLLSASQQTASRIYVILTMRSDYLGDCAQFRDLPEAINESQYLIPRLTRDQLRAAITGPIAVGGGKISPRLLNRLLNDVGDDQDQLPVLQHAMMRMWDEWKRGIKSGSDVASTEHSVLSTRHSPTQHLIPIDLCHYEAIGGMAEALSRHADEAYFELSEGSQRNIAEKLFKCLTEKGDDNREIRRPMTLKEICAVVDAPQSEMISNIEVFRRPGRSFLMPPAETKLQAESLIDISHESLIRVWSRLSLWVNQEAISAQRYRRLAQTAALHQKGEEELLHGVGLIAMHEWFLAVEPTPQWAARYPVENSDFALAINFLTKSRQEAETEKIRLAKAVQEKEEQQQRELAQAQAIAEAQKLRAEEQERFAGKLRWLSRAMVLLSLLAITTAGFAYSWFLDANKLKVQAEASNKEVIRQKAAVEMAKDLADRERDNAKDLESQAHEAKDQAERQKDKAQKAAEAAKKSAAEAEDQRNIAEQRRQAAELSERQAKRMEAIAITEKSNTAQFKYVASMGAAQNAFAESNPLRGNELLEEFIPKSDPATKDLRNFYWYYLWKANHIENLTLRGHSDAVNSIALSPDGKTLASASADSTIKLWDVASQQEVATLEGHSAAVTSVAFNNDGKMLVSASRDGTVMLWDIASQRAATLKGGGSVSSVAFSSDGKMLASASASVIRPKGKPSRRIGIVKLWDVASQKEVATLEDQGAAVTSVAFSSDGKMLASASADTVKLWDVARRQEVATLKGHSDTVNSITLSPDGKTLASASVDNTVKLWDVTSQKEMATLEDHSAAITSVAFNSDGKTLASASVDGIIKLWNVASQKEVTILRGHTNSVDSIVFSPDGKTLISAGEDSTIKFWSTQTDQSFLVGNVTGEKAVAFSRDGETLASATDGNEIKLWDVKSQSEIAKFNGHTNEINSIIFSSDGLLIASASNDKTVRLWDVKGQKELYRFSHNNEVSLVAFSGDNQFLISASADGIRLWDTQQGKNLGVLDTYAGGTWGFEVFPDGKKFANVSDDQTVNIWDIQTRKKRVLKCLKELLESP